MGLAVKRRPPRSHRLHLHSPRDNMAAMTNTDSLKHEAAKGCVSSRERALVLP